MRARRLQHRSVGIAVIGGDGRLLIHRRSETKDIWPGWWDIAVGGVVAIGESYEDAAHRELAEELGIDDAAFEFVGRAHYVDNDLAAICHGFRMVHDGPCTFADGEVADAMGDVRRARRDAFDAPLPSGQHRVAAAADPPQASVTDQRRDAGRSGC